MTEPLTNARLAEIKHDLRTLKWTYDLSADGDVDEWFPIFAKMIDDLIAENERLQKLVQTTFVD